MDKVAKLQNEIAQLAQSKSFLYSWGRECSKSMHDASLLSSYQGANSVGALFYNRIIGAYFVAIRQPGDAFLRTYLGRMQLHPEDGRPSLVLLVKTQDDRYFPHGHAFLYEPSGQFVVRVKNREEIRMEQEPSQAWLLRPLTHKGRGGFTEPDAGTNYGVDRGQRPGQMAALFKAAAPSLPSAVAPAAGNSAIRPRNLPLSLASPVFQATVKEANRSRVAPPSRRADAQHAQSVYEQRGLLQRGG